MAIKLNITKQVREYDINGEIFVLSLADEDLLQSLKALQKCENVDPQASLEDVRDLMIATYDELFGKDKGQELYEAVGKSTPTMIEVLSQIGEDLQSVAEQRKANIYKEKLSDLR